MVDNHQPESAYIHIPFCKSKCKYCSFISGTDLSFKKEYLSALSTEINYYYKSEPLKTLYIGGGTPSVLNLSEIQDIIKHFNLYENAEITIELNPNDISQEYMDGLKSLGFNRISIGAQTFNNEILKNIGRRHSCGEIYNAVKTAKKSGFNNISLDLIYGLPNQNLTDFEKDLQKIIDLDIAHISLYGLKIDKGCYFYENLPENIPNDDTQADMYLMAGELTRLNGYNHYEISNYSKSGFESKHNTNYWKCGEYFGFGLSAHGFIDGIRYSNSSDIKNYINNPIEHSYEKKLSKHEMLEERIFLGLRLAEGINKSEINTEFGIDFDKKYKSVLDKYISIGYIIPVENGYRLNDNKETNGFLLSNIIMSEFIS